MNKQDVAILTTNVIAEKLKERLNEFPNELKNVSILKTRKNTNIFYWNYKPFFGDINERLDITGILSDFEESKEEGYRLLVNGDDQFVEIMENKVGEEVFEGYDMEYHFNFIDDMKYNVIKETVDDIISELNLVENISEIDTNKLIVELDKINSIVTSLKDNTNDVINENYGV